MLHYSTKILTQAVSVAVLMGPCAVVCAQAQEIDRASSGSNFISKYKTTGKLEKYSLQGRIAVTPLLLTSIDGFAEPRTELGRTLLEYRRKALAQGMKLLTADEIDSMVKKDRGEFV